MYQNYNNCISCGTISNGKPQCFECWCKSISYIEDEELYETLFTKEEYINEYNRLLKIAKNSKNKEKTQENCINLIGLALFSKNCYIKGIVKNSEIIINDTYSKVENILNKQVTTKTTLQPIDENIDNEIQDFRKEFPTDIHCQDGHYVRSKDERTIDDYLYNEAKLLHAYEPKFRLTEEEKKICIKAGFEYEYFLPDFYIPKYNLYLEFFGKDDEQYTKKMNLKINILSNRKNINFRYITYKDGNLLIEKLEDILEEFKNK